MPLILRMILIGCSLATAACAPAVKHEPAVAFQAAQESRQIRLPQGLDVSLSTGYTTHIKPQTTWVLVGTLPEGEVYKPRDQVLTVEGADVHEAYLVLAGDELVGFYLPVEHAFARISPARRLSVER